MEKRLHDTMTSSNVIVFKRLRIELCTLKRYACVFKCFHLFLEGQCTRENGFLNDTDQQTMQYYNNNNNANYNNNEKFVMMMMKLIIIK